MLKLIKTLPNQLEQGLKTRAEGQLPKERMFSNIVVAGMGGSAIGGDIVQTLFLRENPIPVLVWRDYHPPALVTQKTLFFAISYSGNTEETLTAYQTAKTRNCPIVAITSGGKLRVWAETDGAPRIILPAGMPPRCALGFLTIPILVLLNQLGLCRSYEDDVLETSRLISQRIGVWQKKASLISKKILGKLPLIYSTTRLLDVAGYRWRCQFNENAKVLSYHSQLPEQNHNEIMGFGGLKFLNTRTTILALLDKETYPRTLFHLQKMLNLIKTGYAGLIRIRSEGVSPLARLFATIVIGDLTTTFLAKRRGVDPIAIPKIDELKRVLSAKKEEYEFNGRGPGCR